MKKLNLYYVYDNVGDMTIAGPVPAANDLVALIGFRDSYIKNPKLPYSYKSLDLVRFAQVEVNENGRLSMAEKSDNDVCTFKGAEVMGTISVLSAELGIDDDLLDEVNVDSEEK